MTSLHIVQPYVPTYRVAFFDALSAALDADGVRMRVVAARPEGTQAARGDAASAPWLTTVAPRTLRLGTRSLTLTSSYHIWRHADGVIVPHMGSSLDAWSALLSGRRKRRVGVWGHIKSYVAPPNPIDARLEAWQLRHSDRVFAYTPGGAEYARACGVESARVTTVLNTVDTGELLDALERTTEERIAHFSAEQGIQGRPTVAYIGGLDASKRIAFLVESLDELWAINPNIVVLIGGRGDDARLLAPAVSRGQARMLGYVGAETKAILGRRSSALLSPGRVGLVSVEALALGLPLLTVEWPWHAPEVEYLEEGRTVFTSENTPRRFAQLIAEHIRSPINFPSRTFPTLTTMTKNFRDGVRSMLG